MWYPEVVEPDSRRVINVLQAGRAIAALAVVIHHGATAALNFTGPFEGVALLRTGRFGVDFFFVLSGFIIYHSTVEKERSLGRYAYARIRRLYLPYWPVGIGIAFLYILLPHVSRVDRYWNWLPTLTLFPTGVPALSVAWTLQHEALFYTLFGLFFFSGLLWLGLAAWAVAILAFWETGLIPVAMINFEFMMGIAVAILYRRGIGHWLLLPLAAALVLAWALGNSSGDHSLLIGLACACAILQLSLMEKRGALRVPEPLIFLGAASYALYLVHSAVIAMVVRIVPGVWPVIVVTGTIASLAAGIGYYWYIELPLLRAARRFSPGKARQPRQAAVP